MVFRSFPRSFTATRNASCSGTPVMIRLHSQSQLPSSSINRCCCTTMVRSSQHSSCSFITSTRSSSLSVRIALSLGSRKMSCKVPFVQLSLMLCPSKPPPPLPRPSTRPIDSFTSSLDPNFSKAALRTALILSGDISLITSVGSSIHFVCLPMASDAIAPGSANRNQHDDVIKWKHFPLYWPFVRGIHRSRWIPLTKASDAELWCFLWSTPQ